MHKNQLPENIFVWVLAPHLETSDPNLAYYYDFTQSIEEYTRVFEILQLPWQWQPVTMDNFRSTIDTIALAADGLTPVVFNLCDGDEVNGTPGVSVVEYLRQKNLLYTGAAADYYRLTTSKIVMKQAFEKAGVATPAWQAITGSDNMPAGICKKLGTPVIVKPAVSGGSIGLGVKNVVSTEAAVAEVVKDIYKGYHGWNLAFGGIVAESFIAGPEYTSLIVGNYQQPENAVLYTPVERVFHKALKEEEKFLSFDRLWETYDEENPIGAYEDFYNYFPPENEQIAAAVTQLGWEAYCAVKGSGYGRVDFRMDSVTGKLYVLEVNAQCGLSEDENYTSIGAIVRLAGVSFAELVQAVLLEGIKDSGSSVS